MWLLKWIFGFDIPSQGYETIAFVTVMSGEAMCFEITSIINVRMSARNREGANKGRNYTRNHQLLHQIIEFQRKIKIKGSTENSSSILKFYPLPSLKRNHRKFKNYY